MFHIQNSKAIKVDAMTFSELGMQESHVEEILKNSIEMLCSEEELKKVYALYIEKYRNEFEPGELTSYELGICKLNEF